MKFLRVYFNYHYTLGSWSVATQYNSCNWSGSWYGDVVNTVSFTTEFGQFGQVQSRTH